MYVYRYPPNNPLSFFLPTRPSNSEALITMPLPTRLLHATSSPYDCGRDPDRRHRTQYCCAVGTVIGLFSVLYLTPLTPHPSLSIYLKRRLHIHQLRIEMTNGSSIAISNRLGVSVESHS